MHLVGPQSRMPGAPNILVASGCQCYGEHFQVGDFCFRGAEVGLIVACCEDEGSHYLVVDKPTMLAVLSPHSRRWSARVGSRDVWRVTEAVSCMAWKIDDDEVTTIML